MSHSIRAKFHSKKAKRERPKSPYGKRTVGLDGGLVRKRGAFVVGRDCNPESLDSPGETKVRRKGKKECYYLAQVRDRER